MSSSDQKKTALKAILHMNYRYLFFLLYLLGIHALHAEELWLESDYLLWSIKKAPVPIPIVTSASLADPLPGALEQPGTKILLGDKDINMGWMNGFRVALGEWIGNSHQFGIEGSFFMLPKTSHQQTINTSGEPGSMNVAVPIYDITGLWGLNGVPGETIFILPGPLSGPGFRGHFSLKVSSELLGSEIDTLVNLVARCGCGIDFIGGFRWVQLKESLSFIGNTSALPDAPIVNGFYNFKDHFKTNNNFYGLLTGLKANYNMNRWLFKGFAKIALGCMNQKVGIKGKSQTSNGNLFYKTENTSHEVLGGGIFAEPTNRGSHHRNEFAIVLESGVNLSYQLSNCFEIGVGYNFLWMNQLIRPGKQIDRKINPTRTALAQASRNSVGIGPDVPVPFGDSVPAPLARGPKRPKFKHHDTDFWTQGLIANLNFRF